MKKGTVKWFNTNKGYGFIEVYGDDDDVFVHHTDINDTGYRALEEGQEVEFDVKDSPRGQQAVNVMKL
ncbi:MAG: cold shock domain-containing protein [Candidatus Aminicenantes bacterium]|nr:cold shock domain-containing protein [Candidatus Aminicenantes bacterium]